MHKNWEKQAHGNVKTGFLTCIIKLGTLIKINEDRQSS